MAFGLIGGTNILFYEYDLNNPLTAAMFGWTGLGSAPK